MSKHSKVLTVSGLNDYIKSIFEMEEILHNVAVNGEISEISSRNENTFFLLKDSESQLSCYSFGKMTFVPEVGEQVLVVGTPKYYFKGGRLSFHVSSIQPFGQGAFHARFVALRNKLENEGLFSPMKKRPIVKFASSVAVVTSLKGAAVQDILQVSRRRNPSMNFFLVDTLVQGVGAPQKIADALALADKLNASTIILARGGGSNEDLEAFNSEICVRAVANCATPVISAIGHETNSTLCDFAADLRAPTPSAAAELAVFLKADFVRDMMSKVFWIQSRVQARLREHENALFGRAQMIQSECEDLLTHEKRVLQQKLFAMRALCERNAQRKKNELFERCFKLSSGSNELVRQKQRALDSCVQRLDDFSPLKILKVGYAKVFHEKKAVASVNTLAPENIIELFFEDGSATAKVQNIKVRKIENLTEGACDATSKEKK